jgi:hypothetical protein
MLSPYHEDVRGRWCIDPHIIDSETTWRCVVSFTSRPLYITGHRPQYPLDTSLVRPRSCRNGMYKWILFTLPGLELRFLDRRARNHSLYRFVLLPVTLNKIYIEIAASSNRSPLWSIGQSSWLRIQRSRVRCQVLPDGGLKRGPLRLVNINENLLESESSSSGLGNRYLRSWGSVALTTQHQATRKNWH